MDWVAYQQDQYGCPSPSIKVLHALPYYSKTRLGEFFKFLITNFVAKVAQTFQNLFGLFEKQHLEIKRCCLGKFFGNWATFLVYYLVTLLPENTHLLCKGTYHCMVELLFDCFTYVEIETYLLVWSNPNL